jgi:hypothetical protein
MKTDFSNLPIEADLKDCLSSAHTDLQILLKDIFTNLAQLSGQLTIYDLYSLFKFNDWNDIFNQLEELENNSCLQGTESLFSILTYSLESDPDIKLLNGPRENTYYKVWAGLMIEEDF